MRFFILLGLVVFLGGCAKHCGEDGPEIHEATKPIVEAIAAYAKEHGEPQSILDVKGIPYKLTPCSEQTELHECEILQNGYYFKFNNDYFVVRLDIWGGTQTTYFELLAKHRYTQCSYLIYKNGKLQDSYLTPRCGVLPSCGEGWKQ